ncbi:hypothetical protein N9N28_16015 [Rubripirellula amarantea]|nr:hypothetical protein [Rubripirellula amarantea]
MPWLFSPSVDLCTFLGSAIIALGLLAIGAPLGLLDRETPEWTWIVAILMIDVAHVYSTGFRVYFDREELVNRPWLYGLTPILAFAMGIAVYSESSSLFWRLLAYLAVFHFIRQQYGWVALYRSRAGESGRWGKWIDTTTIYLATVYPLIYWHTHLPRKFFWFLEGDFAKLPDFVSTVAAPMYWAAMAAYTCKAIYQGVALKQFNPGKDIVVLTTAVCWYVGIILFDSDYAFTVTNVIIHGIPYMVLVYWYSVKARPRERSGNLRFLVRFLGVIWILAYLEELLWDTGIWHERAWLFGGSLDLTSVQLFVVPLLAVPQITHYVLDGFIWRRRTNTRFSKLVQ